MNINRVEFSGNLASDAQMREAGASHVTGFRIAVNPRRRGGKEEGETMWFNCSLWGKERGQGILQYLKKGQRVVVFGSLSQDSYTDKNSGETRTSYDIRVDSVDFVNSTREDATKPAANLDELPF